MCAATARRVLLLSSNPMKLKEYSRNFARYGIEVVHEHLNESTHDKLKARDQRTVNQLLKKHSALAVLKDDTALFQHGSSAPAEMRQLELVDNFSKLLVYQLKGQKKETEVTATQSSHPEDAEVECKEYTHVTKGWIDLSRKRSDEDSVFGWDDIFILKSVGLSYWELGRASSKISSRDMVLSQFIKDRFYYKARQDLRFNPQNQSRTIDFGNSVASFINNNVHLNNALANKTGLFALFKTVVNQGVHFRSPINRREKNYWFPGLNAGIPLTPKKDPIHEITFMAHDFGHFLIPDLIFTGSETTELQRLVGICFRMLSEAITMVLADVLLVNTLHRSGFEYDYSKRKIYPLFQDTGLKFGDSPGEVLPVLKKLVNANVLYTLKGDDSGWRALIDANPAQTGKPNRYSNLELFKAKYSPFFTEDYRWTVRNYEYMSKHPVEFQLWWSLVSELRSLSPTDLRMYSIDEYIRLMNKRNGRNLPSSAENTDVVSLVFNLLWETTIAPIFSSTHSLDLIPPSQYLFNAFLRYMMGQFSIFSAYTTIPECDMYKNGLLTLLRQGSERVRNGGSFTVQDINHALDYYGDFVNLLQQKNLITADDAATFKEMHPLFDPVYVNYDDKVTTYPTIESVFRSVFKATLPRVSDSSTSVARPTSISESESESAPSTPTPLPELTFKQRLIDLVNFAGGEVVDDCFVSRPGVVILEKSTLSDEARRIFNSMNVDRQAPEYLQLGEFKSRLTYLSFLKQPMSSSKYHDTMINVHKHFSPYAGTTVTFLIAGCSVETSLELVAHHEASVARLTSSSTKAMCHTLYRLQPEAGGIECQKNFTQHVLRLRAELLKSNAVVFAKNEERGAKKSADQLTMEQFNMLNSCSKATALTFTMNIKDFHKLFIGRLNPMGNEVEVQQICREMALQLYQLYPVIIQHPDKYIEMNNGAKLNVQ